MIGLLSLVFSDCSPTAPAQETQLAVTQAIIATETKAASASSFASHALKMPV
jgi:hypothetical protein